MLPVWVSVLFALILSLVVSGLLPFRRAGLRKQPPAAALQCSARMFLESQWGLGFVPIPWGEASACIDCGKAVQVQSAQVFS